MSDPLTESGLPDKGLAKGAPARGTQPVILSPGEEVIEPARAYALGLTVDAERMEEAHRRRDMKALITNGHHMETILRESVIPILQMAEELPGMDGDEHTDLLRSCDRAVYEWDKRARRTGLDWWNR
jgi:L-rhamnose isomerase